MICVLTYRKILRRLCSCVISTVVHTTTTVLSVFPFPEFAEHVLVGFLSTQTCLGSYTSTSSESACVQNLEIRSVKAFTDFTVSKISLPVIILYVRSEISLTNNSWTDLAVRTKFDQYYSAVLEYRTVQPLNWFLWYNQSINLLVKSFVSESSDPGSKGFHWLLLTVFYSKRILCKYLYMHFWSVSLFSRHIRVFLLVIEWNWPVVVMSDVDVEMMNITWASWCAFGIPRYISAASTAKQLYSQSSQSHRIRVRHNAEPTESIPFSKGCG